MAFSALLAAPSLATQGSPRDAAIAAFLRQDLAEAQRLSRAWLDTHPEDGEIHRLLGMVTLTAGMKREGEHAPRDEFLPLYRTALDALLAAERLAKGVAQPDLNHAVGYILLAEGRLPEAESRLTRAIAEKPQNFVLYRLRGTARGELGRYSEAEADLAKAVTLNPSDLTSRLFLAHVMRLQGRHRDAMDSLRGYLSTIETERPDERHFRTLYDIAKYALFLNDIDAARGPLERACAIDDESLVCKTELGKLYHRIEEFDAAAKQLDAVLAAGPQDPDLYREALHYRGLLAQDRREYAAARDYFEKALALAPKRSETLKAYAAVLKKLGEREAARVVLETLRAVVEAENEIGRLRARLTSDPRDRGARVELIGKLIDVGESGEASRELEELRRRFPTDPAIDGLARRVGPATGS